MLRERMVLGDCYILQEYAGDESYTENWIATAIFSATKFLLRFFKDGLADEASINGVLSETMACYNVRSRFVSDVIELESFSGRRYVSCDYHGEMTLASFAREGKTASLGEICRFGASLAIGLQSFHDAGVVYGNLTDENVLIEIGDYSNIPKVRKPSMLSMALSHPEAYAEGRGYIAPEIRAGETGSAASDMYSIGVHFVRLVTGMMPYPNVAAVKAGEGASLRFSTNALFRRGVPVSIVKIAIRCMMADPALRYQSCAELVSDIRRALHEPQSAAEGDGDGRVAQRADKAAYRIPEFSSDEYFNAASRSRESDARYPAQVAQESLERTQSAEREELRVTDEERAWSVDEYIAYGKSVVLSAVEEMPSPPLSEEDTRKGKSIDLDRPESFTPPVKPAIPETIPLSEIIRSSLLGEEPAPAGDFIQQVTSLPTSTSKIAQRGNAPRVKRARATERENAISGRTWSKQRILATDVPDIVEKAAKRAALGNGGVRFIQEPEAGPANTQLFTTLADLSSKCLYVNIGSFARFGTADLEDFLLMLRKSLATALSGASKNSLRATVRAVSRYDRYGAFAQAPLGKILYGVNSRAKKDRDALGDDYPASLAKAIAAFGREGRPLVIVARGGERIGRELNGVISALSRDLSDARVAIVVFFEHSRVPSWHVLSMLSL